MCFCECECVSLCVWMWVSVFVTLSVWVCPSLRWQVHIKNHTFAFIAKPVLRNVYWLFQNKFPRFRFSYDYNKINKPNKNCTIFMCFCTVLCNTIIQYKPTKCIFYKSILFILSLPFSSSTYQTAHTDACSTHHIITLFTTVFLKLNPTVQNMK